VVRRGWWPPRVLACAYLTIVLAALGWFALSVLLHDPEGGANLGGVPLLFVTAPWSLIVFVAAPSIATFAVGVVVGATLNATSVWGLGHFFVKRVEFGRASVGKVPRATSKARVSRPIAKWEQTNVWAWPRDPKACPQDRANHSTLEAETCSVLRSRALPAAVSDHHQGSGQARCSTNGPRPSTRYRATVTPHGSRHS
jgi:hypothetical protein